MKLLLHTCCADCLIRYLEVLNLKPQDELLINNSPSSRPPRTENSLNFQLSDLAIFYTNSNIYPKSEYDHRLETLREITDRYHLSLIIADYQPQDLFALNPPHHKPSSSQLNFPPQSQRCSPCWSLRLSKTFDAALNQDFTHFSTTLLVSQYQNRAALMQIGQNLAFSKSNQLSFFALNTSPAQYYKTGGFYKQNYCGCLYSLIEKTTQKYSN